MERISPVQFTGVGNERQNEINIYLGGKEVQVAKGFSFGPYMHDFHDVQYCLSGGFTLSLNDVPFEIAAGTLYCVPPYIKVEKHFTGERTSSVFVGVKGLAIERYFKALGLSAKSPVFPHRLPETTAERMEELVESLDTHSLLTFPEGCSSPVQEFVSRSGGDSPAFEGYLRRTGLFSLFLSELMRLHGGSSGEDESESARRTYVDKAVQYIEANYPYDINVDTVSRHVGLNRSYLYSIFRSETGLSVREFIIKTRMRAACDFLRHQDVQIKTVAASVGYEPVAFAHIFKKTIGMSAAEYRGKYKSGE